MTQNLFKVNPNLLISCRVRIVSKLPALQKTSKQTYDSKCHNGRTPERTAQSVTGDFIFTKPTHNSCFPYSRVILVGMGLIEGFPQIWRTWIVRNSRGHYSTQVSFNSHNAHCYFFMHCTTILCTKKTCIFATLTVYTCCT
jgi:hypothetical protein